MSKVSVIVPCYNCADTVTATLDSLYNQTLKDLEIIAINDGSTDHTLVVLNHYNETHPDFNLQVFTKENEGVAEARNFGLAKVTSPYFGFLDSDDTAEPEMFSDLYELAERDHLQVAVSDFLWVNAKGERYQKEGPYGIHQDMMVNLFAVLWNKLYRTDFIRSLDISFPKGDRYEDNCFLYCLVMHVEKIGFTNKAYVRYMQHDMSITHNNNDQVKNMVHVFEIILQYYKKHGKYKEYHDALEYITIKAFLGNSFLRSARIEDKEDRRNTIFLGLNLLSKEFPYWHKNPYLKSMPGMKHKVWRMMNRYNIMFFAWVFRNFKKDNL